MKDKEFDGRLGFDPELRTACFSGKEDRGFNIDNTPLLDIKPYVPEFAAGTRVRIGWLKGKL
jgi:hypothetical protein